jgi:hypothetical protein
MIKPFKFLQCHLLMYSHEHKPIYAGEIFYAVPKLDLDLLNGGKLEKYKITMRFVHKQNKDIYKPDHEKLWYFKTKETAEFYVGHWKRQDDFENWYEKLRRRRTR